MSQSDLPADRLAAEAVVRHHSELAATLHRHVTQLVDAADAGIARQVWVHHGELVAWLHGELLPHAAAEEASLYPAAGDLPAGGPLVEGMLGEHRVITALVAELEGAGSPVRVVAAARALQALFGSHLAKENDLIVPLLVAADDRSLAELLDGLHDIIGAGAGTSGGGCGGGGCGGDAAAGPSVVDADAAAGSSDVDAGGGSSAGGCGGGGCGCGGDAAGAADAEAPVLGIDARIDVRDLPHGERHARNLSALDDLPDDAALILVAPHAPLPLLAEIDTRYAGRVAGEWLQDGPEVWQIRLHRYSAAV